MKLKWTKGSYGVYSAVCGEFCCLVQPWNDDPFSWRIDLNGRVHKNGSCQTIKAGKEAIHEFLVAEVYKMIDEAGMSDILDGG